MATTHQVAITIVAPVRLGSLDELKATLHGMSADPAASIIPFGQLEGVHFARLMIIPPPDGVAGADFSLAFILDCDAPQRAPMRQLVTTVGAGVDAVFKSCLGYPPEEDRSPRARLTYLRSHMAPVAAYYVNTIGRTLEQIRQEAALRDEIELFLDSRGHQWKALTATSARVEIQRFIAGRKDLRWAQQPAPKPSLAWRVGELLHFGAGVLLVLVCLPFVLLALPALALALRRRERTDPAPRLTPDDSHIQELAAVEDILAQNQFAAIGEVKAGSFRRQVARTVLWLVNLGTRHIYNRGVLTGVKSIHAARWVFLKDYHRLIFVSNYDGSLENYMDDFIDKVSWGLNAVFSNGEGYPRTNWLVRDGARDEQAFKSYIRTKQKVAEVWYAAYGHLTTLNIENNARIRAGLSGPMDESRAAAWLRLL